MKDLHTPVMREEVMGLLALRPGMCVVDATVGCGGHAEAILERIGRRGILIGIDWDDAALSAAGERLSSMGGDVRLHRRNFSALKEILAEEGVERADAVLFDLGVSSLQLDSPERGFSFNAAAPLDMRMDRRGRMTAADLLARCSVGDLEKILREYGEEPGARAIAKEVCRRGSPRETLAMAELVRRVCARRGVRAGRTHPATRVFQALRIAVNDELSNLTSAIPAAIEAARSGARIVVISFHSLEDRIVKSSFERAARGCTCPPDFPVCRCGKGPVLKVLTKKPLRPRAGEVAENPRARSARLRAAEKL